MLERTLLSQGKYEEERKKPGKGGEGRPVFMVFQAGKPGVDMGGGRMPVDSRHPLQLNHCGRQQPPGNQWLARNSVNQQ